MIVTIEQFKKWLDTGREIEFNYEGLEYFIGNYEEGRAIFQLNAIKTPYYKDSNEFLEKAFINNKCIKEIILNNQLKIITIF